MTNILGLPPPYLYASWDLGNRYEYFNAGLGITFMRSLTTTVRRGQFFYLGIYSRLELCVSTYSQTPGSRLVLRDRGF